MTDSDPAGRDVFDLEQIRQLIELMKEHDLAQVDLRQGEQRIQLKRGPEGAPNSFLPTTPPSVSETPPKPPPAEPAETGKADSDNFIFIKSPMVGTFYAKPNPESKSFVNVGDLVSPDTTVCIVEAMKVFNEIPADVSGRIVAVLVENEEPVEFGKPLFKVDTNG